MAKPTTARVWADIPEALDVQLKARAKRTGRTRDQVIAAAIEAYLDHYEPSTHPAEPEEGPTLKEFLNGASRRSRDAGQGGDEFCFARLAPATR